MKNNFSAYQKHFLDFVNSEYPFAFEADYSRGSDPYDSEIKNFISDFFIYLKSKQINILPKPEIQLPDGKIYIYLIDTKTNSFISETCILKDYAGRFDIISATINKLIHKSKKYNETYKIRMSPYKLSKPNTIVKWEIK